MWPVTATLMPSPIITRPPVPAQMRILGVLFPVSALVLDSAWAAIADTARRWLVRSPQRLAMIGGTGGLVMIGLGISVAVTGRKD